MKVSVAAMVRVLLVAGLLTALLVSGCASPSGKGGDDPVPEAFDDVVVTDTTGAIRGVVVTQAIVPIEGVLVTLAGGENRSTDAEGAFVFSNLEPGDYFITATKQGFLPVQATATVVAGDREPPVTKVTLPLDPGALKPFYQEYQFDGYIQCSGTFVVVGAAVCSIADLTGDLTDDNFGITYPMEQEPSWMQSELVWESTQAAGAKMSVMYSWDCGDENGGFLCDHGAAGTSPVLLVANATAIDEINEGDYNGTELFVRVFNEGLDESQGRLGATVNQKFTIYSHFFYGYQPPEGWRFSDNTGVPRPPA
jgi:Carboxypeptidase regulatory-like domain